MRSDIMQEHLMIGRATPVIVRHFDYERFTYTWHYHRQYEIIYIKDGAGSSYVADYKGEFCSGDLLIIGSNVPHYLMTDQSSGDGIQRVKGTIIQFAEDYMEHSITNYTDFKHIKHLLDSSQRGVLIRTEGNRKLLKILKLIPKKSATEQIIMVLRALDLLARESNIIILGSLQYLENRAISPQGRLKKVLDYISINYTENINLGVMAELAAMNSSAFSRYFKDKTSKTLTQYILDFRIGFACKQLIESECDITEIAFLSGFRSSTYFSKIFKRTKGISPSEYRKVMR